MWLDWQTLCALAIVAMATGLLIRRAARYVSSKESSSCGSCPNKSAPPLMKTTPLVQITSLPNVTRRDLQR